MVNDRRTGLSLYEAINETISTTKNIPPIFTDSYLKDLRKALIKRLKFIIGRAKRNRATFIYPTLSCVFASNARELRGIKFPS